MNCFSPKISNSVCIWTEKAELKILLISGKARMERVDFLKDQNWEFIIIIIIPVSPTCV